MLVVRETAVRQPPVKWQFSDNNHGIVLLGINDRVTLEGGSLVWQHHSANANEQLVVGFDHPSPAPRGVRITWHTLGDDAVLGVSVTDRGGKTYWEPRRLNVSSEPNTVELDFSQFVLFREVAPPFDPSAGPQARHPRLHRPREPGGQLPGPPHRHRRLRGLLIS